MNDIPEITRQELARAISARVRRRLVRGRFESGADVTMLRRFVGLTQSRFARALGISVHTLRNWEQGRRHPEGPSIALLRIAARHPRIIRENLKSVAWQPQGGWPHDSIPASSQSSKQTGSGWPAQSSKSSVGSIPGKSGPGDGGARPPRKR